MSSFTINGGKPLSGEITVAGNKNAIMPCLAASILTPETSTFTNVPDIEDVKTSIQILQDLGAKVERPQADTITVTPGNLSKTELSPELVAKLRSSILYLGPLLGRFGEATMRHPGGCILGRRPVGTHFQAIRDFGGSVITTEGNYQGTFSNRANDTIFLDEASVTATENLMCLAAATPGKTTILGAACEPHVVNLADYLNAMGAHVTGAGTNTITIKGTDKLHGAKHEISSDYIETGTFAILAAATHSHITIHQAQPQDFHMIGTYLKAFGVEFTFHDGHILEVKPSDLHTPEHIKEIQTRPWPGFPTDVLSPLVVLATQAQGATLIHEWMYDGRLLFSDKLITMGADIVTCDPHRIIVKGKTPLRGKHLTSPDIRAGIALVIAGLIATGETIIDHTELIGRGYQNLAPRLQALGADIEETN